MDQKIIDVLYVANWHYINGLKQHKIVKFTDASGGLWDVSIPKGPCGCEIVGEDNPYRFFLYCKDHPEGGILVFHYATSQWVWIPSKLEEGKK